MKLWLEISDWSPRDSTRVGRLINTTFILIALGFLGRIASSGAAAVSGRNRSSVKSRRWCQRGAGLMGTWTVMWRWRVCTTEVHRDSYSGSRGGQVMSVSLKIPAQLFDALPGSAWASVQALQLPPSSQNTNIRLSGDSQLSWV